MALFTFFIFFCGLTHLVMPYSMYNESVRVVMLYICCAISVTTAIASTFIFPALRNITDKLELNEEGMLQQVQSSLMEMIEACQESIVVMTSDWRIVTSNAITKQFFGENCAAVSFLTLVHEEDQDKLMKVIGDALCRERRSFGVDGADVEMGCAAPKSHHRVEYRVRDNCGDWMWVESTLMITGCSSLLSTPDDGGSNLLWGVSCSDDRSLPSSARLMMLSRNISDLKREERLQQEAANTKIKEEENTAKLMYITSCAHELKTPLQSFNYAIELLKTTPLLPDQLDILHQARVSSLMLSMTISQTMDTSKVMVGDRLVPRKGSVALSEVVSRVAIVIDCYSRHVPVSFNLGSGIHNSIITDKEWLWQMIVNNLTNACKYTERGSIDVNVMLWSAVPDKTLYGCTDEKSSGDFLLFQTVDTGIGISNKNIPTLFSMFGMAQAGQSTGTGMGLYGIKVRAEGLGGSCGVVQRPRYDGQEGSVFWFKIPYLVDDVDPMSGRTSNSFLAEDSHFNGVHGSLFAFVKSKENELRMSLRSESSSAGGTASLNCLRVAQQADNPIVLDTPALHADSIAAPNGLNLTAFVVDDVPSIRKLLKRTLLHMGFKRIELFENGSKALAAMKVEVVDIVFMDIQMPIMSGPEVSSV